MRRGILACLLWLVSLPALATTYYVDSSITDTNVASATPDFTTYNPATFATTGGSASVYKTVADVNAKTLSAGDSVLFRRGQTWRETLSPPSSGSSGNPITYGTFGTGAIPVLSGANIYAGSWTSESSSTNLVSNPSAFGSWTADGVTISANVGGVTDPDGGTASDGLVPSAVEAEHRVYSVFTASAGTDYTVSVWARPGSKNWIQIAILYFDGGFSYLGAGSVYANVATGEKGSEGATPTSSWVSSVAVNSFYRVGVSQLAPTGTVNAMVSIWSADADGDLSFTGNASTVSTYLYGAVGNTSSAQFGTAYYGTSITIATNGIWLNGSLLNRCAMKACLTRNDFWYDDPNDRIYVKTSTLADPTGSTTEVSQRSFGVNINDKDYIKVSGLEVVRWNDIGVLSTAASNPDVSFLYIHDGIGAGISVSGTDHGKFYYNVIDNTGVSPNGYWNGIDINVSSTLNEIYNNTIRRSWGASITNETSSTTNIIKNNILDSTGNVGPYKLCIYVDAATAAVTLGTNLYYFTGILGNWKSALKTSLVDWVTASGESGAVAANPLLNSDFSLQPGSPAISAGANLGATYQLGAGPNGATLSQYAYGAWEIGVYVYPDGLLSGMGQFGVGR